MEMEFCQVSSVLSVSAGVRRMPVETTVGFLEATRVTNRAAVTRHRTETMH